MCTDKMCGVELLQLSKMCASIVSMKGLMFCKFYLYTAVSLNPQSRQDCCHVHKNLFTVSDLIVLLAYIHRTKTKCDMADEVALLLTGDQITLL